MASITATTELLNDHYLVTITLNPGSNLPNEVFVYENSGDNTLGEYYGVCSLEDIARLKIFSGVTIPTFGNRFLRYGQAKIKVNLPNDPNAVIDVVANSLRQLLIAFNANHTSTKVINL